MPKEAPRAPQERPNGDLGTRLVIVLDMSSMITFNTMLGIILRMMCRNTLKIRLEDHVQQYVADDLEHDFEYYFQDNDQDECVDSVAHVL